MQAVQQLIREIIYHLVRYLPPARPPPPHKYTSLVGKGYYFKRQYEMYFWAQSSIYHGQVAIDSYNVQIKSGFKY